MPRILCTSAQPKAPQARLRSGLHSVIDSLLSAQHVLEMFRRTLLSGNCPNLPWPPLESSHQNLHRNEKAQAPLKAGREWPAKPTIRSGFLKMLSDRPGPGPRRCRSISTMLETGMSPNTSIAHCREAVFIMVVVCLAGANNETAPSRCFCLDRGSRP
jgi:hypothetical protein